MKQPTLVVMAAGMGSRYGGLKQVDPVGPGGQIIMEYSLFDAKRAGFERVVFVISAAMEKDFPSSIREKVGDALQMDFVVQHLTDIPEGYQLPEGRTKPWGTAHAIRACRNVVDAPFAAINADDYYGSHAFDAMYKFLSNVKDDAKPSEYVMVGYELINTLSMEGSVARGICETDHNGHLVAIKERTHVVWSSDGALYMDADELYRKLPEGALASLNLWGFTPDFLGELDSRFARFLDSEVKENPLKAEFYLPEAVGQMLREGEARATVLPNSDRWYGVTYKNDRPIVQEAILRMTKEGLYPEKLW